MRTMGGLIHTGQMPSETNRTRGAKNRSTDNAPCR
jgi:hypothetical protein